MAVVAVATLQKAQLISNCPDTQEQILEEVVPETQQQVEEVAPATQEQPDVEMSTEKTRLVEYECSGPKDTSPDQMG